MGWTSAGNRNNTYYRNDIKPFVNTVNQDWSGFGFSKGLFVVTILSIICVVRRLQYYFNENL